MKPRKIGCLIFVILLLLLQTVIHAQEEVTITPDTNPGGPQLPTSTESTEENQIITQNNNLLNNNTGLLNNATGASKDAITGAINQTEIEIIQLPRFLQTPSQFLFNTDSEPLSLQAFLTLLAIFVLLFVMLNEITKEFSDKKLLSRSIALVLTCIAALLGVIYNAYIILQDIATLVVFGESRIIQIVVIVIILLAIFFLFKICLNIFHSFKEESKEEEAYKDGKAIKAFINVAKHRLKKV